MSRTKILLKESEMPKQWYNIAADMPNIPKPPLSPKTKKPITPEELAPIFPESLIEQEMSTTRWIGIPEEVLDIYSLWRPAPLYRAHRLEAALKTPAHIYYKNEGVSPAGSHKPNTAIPQAYFNKQEGVKRLATETGAGQWGSALSLACSFFGMECMVYMVRVSYEQKPYRRSMMRLWGADVVASPSTKTAAGRRIFEQDPDSLGSLGIAISEAVEDAASRDDTKYALGSVLNHVLLHQTIIGLEAKLQLAKVNEYPDVVVGCHGGGSNFGGVAFPFLMDVLAGDRQVRTVAIEPTACPTLTKGRFAYDYGDVAHLTPIAAMYTLGHDFMPAGIHAGGLRYHGASPLVSQLCADGFIEAKAVGQVGVFEAAQLFARTEGIVPAPESAHAVKGAIDEALRCREEGKKETILFCLSGNGYLDLASYDAFLAGQLQDFEYPDKQLEESFAKLPKI